MCKKITKKQLLWAARIASMVLAVALWICAIINLALQFNPRELMLSLFWIFFAAKIVLCRFNWPEKFCKYFPYMMNYLGSGFFHI